MIQVIMYFCQESPKQGGGQQPQQHAPNSQQTPQQQANPRPPFNQPNQQQNITPLKSVPLMSIPPPNILPASNNGLTIFFYVSK
jgi:hypothetical protein